MNDELYTETKKQISKAKIGEKKTEAKVAETKSEPVKRTRPASEETQVRRRRISRTAE